VRQPASLKSMGFRPAGPAAPGSLRRGPVAFCRGPRRDREDLILEPDGVTAKVTPSALMRLSRYRSPRTTISCSNRDVL
jgi:hypothetical protein